MHERIVESRYYLDLHSFSNSETDPIKYRREKFKKKLSSLDAEIDDGHGSETLVNKRLEVINEMKKLDKFNDMDMVQKARIKWAVEGDENYKFFHGMLNRKRHQQSIRGVMTDEVWKDKPRTLDADQQADLEREAKFPKGCNSSFIALIPKIPDANMVKDFRPICLIGSMYTIIAKILSNRLVGVLGDLVSEVQSAFIAERQILDGPFILNEVLNWCKKKKKKSIIFKVDFEKAYDSVRWDFLDEVLKKFGFGSKWCEWIQGCLCSSRGSILSMWSDSNITTLVHVLDCFFRASGLRINMKKSKIFE
nr:RNA-directed DNA polymerase, eukaryota, reverse transcriptase zinc-binding domain protein [Tanacetum cinerariifolium]